MLFNIREGDTPPDALKYRLSDADLIDIKMLDCNLLDVCKLDKRKCFGGIRPGYAPDDVNKSG